jgi:hypothetical protein
MQKTWLCLLVAATVWMATDVQTKERSAGGPGCGDAGSRSTEARGAEQSGKAGAEGRGFGDQTGLSGSNWIMKKNGGFVEVYCFVGVPDGI